jgi:hypothetical protein
MSSSRNWNKQINPMTAYRHGTLRGIQGAGNEQLVAARALKHGFLVFFKLWSDAKYDMVLECENELFRVQVKGTQTNRVSFESGGRGGIQRPISRARLLTRADCDIFIGVKANTGDCYVIPIDYVVSLGKKSSTWNRLQPFLERWDYIRGNRFLTASQSKNGLSSSELQNNLRQILPHGWPVPSDLNQLRTQFYERCPP